MRFPAALVAFAFVVTPLPYARVARAADCSGVLSPCIDDDILWPHAGPAQFVAVGSTETVGSGRLGFGLVSTYLSRPIVIHVPAPGNGGTDAFAVDHLVDGTFLWAYGVNDRLELDLAVPLTYYQQGAGISPISGGGNLNDTATRDLRFGFAYAILRHAGKGSRRDGFGLAGRIEVSAPTGDRAELAAEGYGTFAPSLAADFRQGRFFAGLEYGARLRPTVDLLGAEVGPQIVTALGVGYDVLARSLLSLALEAWALPTLSQQKDLLVGGVGGGQYATTLNGTYIAPAEWHLSARTAPVHGGDLSIEVGGGGALPVSGDVVTQPRFRFTLGVRWAPAGPIGAPPAPPSP